MKKIFILLFAGMLFLQKSYSQVQYNGYLIGQNQNNTVVTYRLANDTGASYLNGGNLGIGTTAPSAKLEVNGNIRADGKVLIGTVDTSKVDSFVLAVNGAAIFTKARVKLYGDWPDFVFDDSYKLLSLTDLEQYIKQNKHLPDVPSDDNTKKEGIDLGDNQVLLLKKIEELTLYIIIQNKKIGDLNDKLAQQEQENIQLQNLQKEVDKLMTLIKKS